MSCNVLLLQHADRSWFALYSDIQYENIAVSHYNQVYLIDHEHLSIIQSVRSPRQRQQQPDVDRPRHRDLGDRRNDPGSNLNNNYCIHVFHFKVTNSDPEFEYKFPD